MIEYIYHPDCLEHEMGEGHPECPQRIDAIEDQLRAAHLFDFVRHYEAPRATRRQLARVHLLDYVDKIIAFSEMEEYERHFLDPDTVVTAKTPKARYGRRVRRCLRQT